MGNNAFELGGQLLGLSKELQVPKPDVNPGALTAAAYIAEMQTKLDEFAKEKRRRLTLYNIKRTEEKELCRKLASAPQARDESKIPSKEELEAFCAHVDKLEEERVWKNCF